ncbi:protein phosphatase 1 regulatory subunit INH3 [Humulus lupulus]|uniref:protein phosphatase 1 regulatory subunit INH3 n=1 Tax=Humulus lupulus TaxID=3486 RepID=UPI002B41730F|nr:protein phosphatase 1 regulatory subunit INH3 [Humulus lupulus]
MARPVSSATRAAVGSLTATITLENPEGSTSSSLSSTQPQKSETLTIRLNRKKKQVSWKEGTVDNEFMQKKSSKKCCIFHKQKPFDEDDSDQENEDHRHDKDDNKGCCSKDHD